MGTDALSDTKYCTQCGNEIADAAEVCPDCGADQTDGRDVLGTAVDDDAETSFDDDEGNRELGLLFAGLGAFSGLVGLLFLPILFGPGAVVCGAISAKVYKRKYGMIVAGWGVLSTILGILIGILVFASMAG